MNFWYIKKYLSVWNASKVTNFLNFQMIITIVREIGFQREISSKYIDQGLKENQNEFANMNKIFTIKYQKLKK